MRKKKPIAIYDGITFSQAVDGIQLNLQARHKSDHTIADYMTTYRKFAAFLREDLPLAAITYSHVEAFLAAQTTVSKKTVLNYHTGLSALWSWAVLFEHVQENVVRKIQPPQPEERAIVPYTEDDVRRILDQLTYSKPYSRPGKRTSRHKLPEADRNRAIIMLLLDTGMRATEICSLKIIEVDMRNRYAIPFGKGDKERKLPFSARTGQALFKYLTTRKGENVNAPLFKTGQNHALDRIQLLKLLHTAGERAGVQDVHPHRFRHTFAIQYLRNGGDAYTLQELLGHTTMEMVRTYLRIAQIDIDRGHRIASPVDNWNL
jgi:site-specific recombinase XerD